VCVPKKRRKRLDKRAIQNFTTLLSMNDDRLGFILRQLCSIEKGDWDLLLNLIRTSTVYKVSYISKGKGKRRRVIHAPHDILKKIQRLILNRVLSEIPTHSARHGGGQRGTSVYTGVGKHIDHAYAFSTDIVNAYPSIFRSRIRACLKPHFRRLLRQFDPLVFPFEDERDARNPPTHDGDILLEALIDLLVFNDQLPQGPPTSPRVLDIVSFQMDCDIWSLAQRSSVLADTYVYTAYADDLTISTSQPIPNEVREEMMRVIKKNGFHPHHSPEKTAYYGPDGGSHPVVTGVLIRDGVMHLPTRKQNQIRATLHQLLSKTEWEIGDASKAAGLVGYIRQVYPKNLNRKLPSKIKDGVECTERRLKQYRLGESEDVLELLPQESDQVITVKSVEAFSSFDDIVPGVQVTWTSHSGYEFQGVVLERSSENAHLAHVEYMAKNGQKKFTRLKCERLTLTS